MAPKKKGGKKAVDDWEAEIGESIDPIAQAAKDAKNEEDAKDAEDDDMGGGLLAALRKSRARKVKKGKTVEDFVEGEDPTEDATNGNASPQVDLSSKAPQEATMDDEDVFGQPMKKGKAGKADKPSEPQEDDDLNANGTIKTKAQKDKEKKERERLRKKEQV